MQTALTTGCSSGFGLETARTFLDRGWAVVATMRQPRADVLPPSDRLRVVALDVTDPASIEAAVTAAGPIDALVNNAGIGWFNALEGTPMAAARQIFETNTFGTMAMTHAVLPAVWRAAVWRAVTDPSCPMRVPAGADAVAMAGSHRTRFRPSGPPCAFGRHRWARGYCDGPCATSDRPGLGGTALGHGRAPARNGALEMTSPISGLALRPGPL